jgi:putative transposase
MASTYLNLNVHMVFATKDRAPTINALWRPEFHAYIGGTIRGLNGLPFAVGGIADHVHILAGLNATHTVADFVREVKKASRAWAVERYDRFGWQTGYGAFSVGAERVETVVAYVNGQEEHHRTITAIDELRALLADHGVAYDERFFE